MAVDDGNLDIEDFEFEDLISNDLEKQYCGLLQVPLCSIQEYLEWFPTSPHDFLSLNDVGLTPEYQSGCLLSPKGQDGGAKGNQQTTEQNLKKHQQNRHEMKKDDIGLDEYLLHGLIGFTRKKCRTKNCQRPKWRVTWERKRCSHCETEETPQWRAGPAGPKTLCNACGVRFKSGRLVAEYRPATSPTFDGRRHSNYHRMILKKLRSST